MNFDSKIFVAGHNGMVGSAIIRELLSQGYKNLLTVEKNKLDLIRQNEVDEFMKKENPDYVFLAAAKVGGIWPNRLYPVQFLYDNIMIESNVINSAAKYKVKKLLFLGSSCIYPRLAKQPIKESELLSGYLEETNEAYAIAKIAGIKLCQSFNKQYNTNFISLMPTNLYGKFDNFNLDNAHVLPAMLRKFDDAKNNKSKVVLWGSGLPKREFLYVDDLANACVFLMNNYNDNEIINVGTGVDISIKDLASILAKITKFEGEIVWDLSKPDGTPRKLLDISKLKEMGWQYKYSLEEGIKITYRWFINNKSNIRK